MLPETPDVYPGLNKTSIPGFQGRGHSEAMADPRIKNPPRNTPGDLPPAGASPAAGETPATPPDHAEHVRHARQNYDYDTEHTTADPDRVPQGPEESYLPLMVAFTSAAIALVAVIFDYFEADTVGLVLAIVALIGGVVSIGMAWTDARAGVGTPILCTVVAAVVLAVVLLDVLDVEELDPASVNRGLVGDDIPEDPADIIEGTPQQRDITAD